MELGENLGIISGLQSVAGKILETKELRELCIDLAMDFFVRGIRMSIWLVEVKVI